MARVLPFTLSRKKPLRSPFDAARGRLFGITLSAHNPLQDLVRQAFGPKPEDEEQEEE
jgi:hypothetical protein